MWAAERSSRKATKRGSCRALVHLVAQAAAQASGTRAGSRAADSLHLPAKAVPGCAARRDRPGVIPKVDCGLRCRNSSPISLCQRGAASKHLNGQRVAELMRPQCVRADTARAGGRSERSTRRRRCQPACRGSAPSPVRRGADLQQRAVDPTEVRRDGLAPSTGIGSTAKRPPCTDSSWPWSQSDRPTVAMMISLAGAKPGVRSSSTARSRKPIGVARSQLSMARFACSGAIAFGQRALSSRWQPPEPPRSPRSRHHGTARGSAERTKSIDDALWPRWWREPV